MLVSEGERISVHIAAGWSGALRRSCEVYFSNWIDVLACEFQLGEGGSNAVNGAPG